MSEQSQPAIPFTFFISLMQAISSIKPKKARHGGTSNFKQAALQTLNNWLAELHRRYSPIPSGVSVAFFRLFFPEEDVSRKYGLQETKLANHLSEILCASRSPHRSSFLQDWQKTDSLGCLGAQVLKAAQVIIVSEDDCISLVQVDALLTELASTSAFSATSIRFSATSHRSPRTILQSLFANMEPFSAAFLTQIILKDLRPLLYPLSETHYTVSLLQYNSSAVSMLTKEDVMKAWDTSGRMLRIYRLRASLEEAAKVYNDTNEEVEPQPGIPVQIPKCIKGHSCSHALKTLRDSERVWVETKYDGERAQIHVQIDELGKSKIQIFSKSKRDSTLDRFAVHSIIRDALGLSVESSKANPSQGASFKANVILEAEMVAFSDDGNKIDEFWRIRSLIASTARGVRHTNTKATNQMSESQLAELSQISLLSDASDNGARHLALVFFDILYLDSQSLVHHPYGDRRKILECIVRLRPGYAMLAERISVGLKSFETGVEQLEGAITKLLSNHQEGAVLKAEESRYCDWNLRWVKMKADYIPGYGDCVDLVLIGAGWDKDRARELRVSPNVYTTFYFGALKNSEAINADSGTTPHFSGIFTSSYGLDREQLEELNFMIKSSDPVECNSNPRQPPPAMPFTYDIPPGLPRPSVLLQTPLLGELYGAGFTKAPKRTFYELRFPRITKIFRSRERSWKDGMSMTELQKIAREAVGKDRPDKDVDDWCKQLWSKPCSPGVKSSSKRKRREEEWAEKLARADGRIPPVKARRFELDLDGDKKVDGYKHKMAKSPERQQEPPSSARRSARALGSLTNVLASNKSPESDGPKTPADLPPSVAALRIMVKTQELQFPVSTPRDFQEFTSCGSDIRPESDERPITPQPISAPKLRYADTSLGKFLENAVVWLVRALGAPRQTWRVPSNHIIPQGHQVHSFDAFLMACGWTSYHPPDACAWAVRGVIFVDEADKGWLDSTLKRLLERRSALLKEHRGSNARGKSVFVMGMQTLSHQGVEMDGDVDTRAICRFG